MSDLSALKVCDQTHGASHNESTVYAHHASVRVCIRMVSGVWVYDPRWEAMSAKARREAMNPDDAD